MDKSQLLICTDSSHVAIVALCTVTIFQVSVIFKLLWPLATTNYGGLQATNRLCVTSQVLWPPATTICGSLWLQNKLLCDVLAEQWSP